MDVSLRTLDANQAVADVAYRGHEVIAIYPITPASPMGEWCDEWAAQGRPNLWETVPAVIEMQSEGGAAGVVHGALQTGSLTTTFTASQGLLLMLPNLFKIAGELTPAVIHVAARTVAAQALSIFGDHSDVMAARGTGWAMLCSGSVQEAQDFALIAQAASLRTRIPFLHFFDGFRTSHEIAKIETLSDGTLHALLDEELIREHRRRGLTPERPVLRGTAQNPDVFFQAREASNPFYARCPGLVQRTMDDFAALTGRAYHLFDYTGAPDADRVVVLMGSGAETADETVRWLVERGERVGVVRVRLYRPFDASALLEALPATVEKLAVLDRTKEPGALGEPLYLDVLGALNERSDEPGRPGRATPRVVGGRYGLSSKELTPAMLKGLFDELAKARPKPHFTLGVHDDISDIALAWDPAFSTEPESVFRALFYGLGSDGTVSANKNTIKILGEGTELQVQGYFVYDSRKAGAVTISHLRVGPDPIRSAYLIDQAQFIGCHQTPFLERYDMLDHLAPGGIFLLNTPHPPEAVWDSLPRPVQEALIAKRAKLFALDAYHVARACGLGKRINTVMQLAFFAVSAVLPLGAAVEAVKAAIQKTYGSRGPEVVDMNLRAVDRALDALRAIEVPATVTSEIRLASPVTPNAPAFVHDVLAEMIARRGDRLPVSALPVDGTYPTGTSQYEKRNLAQEIPVWDTEVCIQCGKCAIVCPHATIRIKIAEPPLLRAAPPTFKSSPARDREWAGKQYLLQVAPEDCTGCGICVDVCPAKNKSETRLKAINMRPQAPLRESEKANWDFFLSLPEVDRRELNTGKVRQQQLQRPLFEFSSACSGCGETPYLKLLSQLFGDRTLVANATGCSSIYGGNLPTTPWATNAEGRGPAWSNSLFEDNAEFGLGFRVSLDQQTALARELLDRLAPSAGFELAQTILDSAQEDEAEIAAQRERVARLVARLEAIDNESARRLLSVADALVKKSVWIVGGDGWAYDIGFGGLDHVLASGRDVNVLVLDTEVYSNTGGQASKATPLGAVAKFAAGGKRVPKKDLGAMAMSYGSVYVAQVAMGARDEQTLKAFLEAESFAGPSLILAYSHCIAHGIEMSTAMGHQRVAVEAAQWLLYRYDPRRTARGETPLVLDSRAPKRRVRDYFDLENRFRMLARSDPKTARALAEGAQAHADDRWRRYRAMAETDPPGPPVVPEVKAPAE